MQRLRCRRRWRVPSPSTSPWFTICRAFASHPNNSMGWVTTTSSSSAAECEGTSLFWGAYKGQTTIHYILAHLFSGSQKWERKEKDPGSFNVGIRTFVRKLPLFMLREFCRCCDRKRGVNAALRERVLCRSRDLCFGGLFSGDPHSFRIVLPSAIFSNVVGFFTTPELSSSAIARGRHLRVRANFLVA